MMRGLVALFFVLAIGTPREALATACCGEASALGERLLAGEAAAAALRVGARGRFGYFDGDGEFHANPPETVDAGSAVTVGAAARVTSHLEIGAELRAELNVREAGGANAAGGGLGDVRAHARFALVRSTDHRYMPGVYATIAAVIPAGHPASRAEPGQLNADVTGQGNGELVVGASLEKTFEGMIVARAEGSVGWFVPETVGAERMARSPRVGVSALLGPVLDPVVVAAGVSYEAEAAPPRAPAETSGRSRLELVVVATLDVDPRTTLIAALRSALPASDAGSHETASASGMLGARFGVFE